MIYNIIIEDDEFYLVNPKVVLWHDYSTAELKIGRFTFTLRSEEEFQRILKLLGQGMKIKATDELKIVTIGNYIHTVEDFKC